MLAAEFAELVHLKSVGVIFLILSRVVISLLACATRQCDLNSHFRHLPIELCEGKPAHSEFMPVQNLHGVPVSARTSLGGAVTS